MNGSPIYSNREQRAWYFYDWANSAFYTTVVAVFLGPYLTSLAKAAADSNGRVYLLGIPLAAQAVWGYTISASVLTQVLTLPLFGAIADYGRRKRELLGVLAYTGATATMAMFFLQGDRWLLACGLFLIANLSLGASIIIYNSFLPEIAPAAERDAVSSKGWAMGYAGGGLLLALNLAMFLNAETLGLTQGAAVRISLASAGLWWALFTIIPLRGLHNRGPQKTPPPGQHYVVVATRQLAHTVSQVRRYPQTLLFLVAFLIYNDGIQTVASMAAQFGSEELHLPLSALTGAILLTQFVAFLGAMLFERTARWLGNRRAVMLSLIIWSATLFYIYAYVHTQTEFYIAAAIVGVVLGGSQALSRSLYSFMIPKGQEAEYFSIYEISDKGTSWLGPLFLGLALQFTGSFRLAIFSIIIFFLTGIAILWKVDVREAAREAGNDPPAKG